MISQKVVTPAKAGVQVSDKPLKSLDSGFRRNDENGCFLTFYEFVIVGSDVPGLSPFQNFGDMYQGNAGSLDIF